MNLNLNFNGKMLLKNWWGIVKANFQTIQDTFNNHKTNSVIDHPDGSVTTAKLADKSVTAAKLADKSVTAAKLANQLVTADKLADDINNEFTNLEQMIRAEEKTRLREDGSIQTALGREKSDREAADKSINQLIDEIKQQNNILDLYGEEVTREFKAVIPSEIPEPELRNESDIYNGIETMEFTAPSDIELYLDGKKLDFTWVNTGDLLNTEEDNCIYLTCDFNLKEVNVFNPPNSAIITPGYKNGVVTLALYNYSDFRVDYKVSSDSPTGDIYIYEGCNKTYASENADTTGVSYTIIQEYSKTRTTEDLTTDNKSCFLDAVNEVGNKTTEMQNKLGVLSAELDAVNGSEEVS